MKVGKIIFLILMTLLLSCTENPTYYNSIKIQSLKIKGKVKQIYENTREYNEFKEQITTYAFESSDISHIPNEEEIEKDKIFYRFKFGKEKLINAVRLIFDEQGNLERKYLKWKDRKELYITYQLYHNGVRLDSIVKLNLKLKETENIFTNDLEIDSIHFSELESLKSSNFHKIIVEDEILEEKKDKRNNWIYRLVNNKNGDTIIVERYITYF